MKKRFISIRVKSTVTVILIIASVASLTGFYLTHKSAKTILAAEMKMMRNLGRTLALNAEYGLLISSKDSLNQISQHVSESLDVEEALVSDQAGEIVTDRPDSISPEEIDGLKEIIRGLNPQNSMVLEMNFSRIGNVFTLIDPVIMVQSTDNLEATLFDHDAADEKIIGYAILIFSKERIDREAASAAKGIVVLLTIVAAVICFAAFIIATIFVQNLNRLKDAFERVRKGELNTRVQINTHDELEILADGFNQMTDELKKTTVSRDLLAQRISERKEFEDRLDRKTMELEAAKEAAEKNAREIGKMNDVMVGRELKMIELKKQIEELKKKLGENVS